MPKSAFFGFENESREWEFMFDKAVRRYDHEWVGWAYDDGSWELFSREGQPGDSGVESGGMYYAMNACDLAAKRFGVDVGSIATPISYSAGRRLEYDDDVVIVRNPSGEIDYKGIFDWCPYKHDFDYGDWRFNGEVYEDQEHPGYTLEVIASDGTSGNIRPFIGKVGEGNTKSSGVYDEMWEEDSDGIWKSIPDWHLSCGIVPVDTGDGMGVSFGWSVLQDSGHVIEDGVAQSKEEAMGCCDAVAQKYVDSVPLGYDGNDFFDSPFEEHMLDMGYPIIGSKARPYRKSAHTTFNGLYYDVVFDIDPSWTGYDEAVAEGQMATYGVVFVDEYGLPIDDEYAADEAADDYDMLMRGASRRMAGVMRVKAYDGLSADGLRVDIDDGFSHTYQYGYDASYNNDWATESQPFIGDIIAGLVVEHGVSEIIVEDKCYHVFSDTVSDGHADKIINDYLDGYVDCRVTKSIVKAASSRPALHDCDGNEAFDKCTVESNRMASESDSIDEWRESDSLNGTLFKHYFIGDEEYVGCAYEDCDGWGNVVGYGWSLDIPDYRAILPSLAKGFSDSIEQAKDDCDAAALDMLMRGASCKQADIDERAEVPFDMLEETQDGYRCELEDGKGDVLELSLSNRSGGWGWMLRDGGEIIADDDFSEFPTAQDALADFNDWCDFNVNGGKVAGWVDCYGEPIAEGDVLEYINESGEPTGQTVKVVKVKGDDYLTVHDDMFLDVYDVDHDDTELQMMKVSGRRPFARRAGEKVAYGYHSYFDDSKWVCHEEGFDGEYSLDDLKSYYKENVDKAEYSEFDDWEWDMVRSGVFFRAAHTKNASGRAVDMAADYWINGGNPYRLLDRCIQDVNYWLGYGNRSDKHLWAGNPQEQYEVIEFLYDVCDPKPDWFTEDDLAVMKEQLGAVDRYASCKRLMKSAGTYELARKLFTSLVKMDHPYVEYAVQEDGYTVDMIDAYTDEEAIEKFLIRCPGATVHNEPVDISNKWASRHHGNTAERASYSALLKSSEHQIGEQYWDPDNQMMHEIVDRQVDYLDDLDDEVYVYLMVDEDGNGWYATDTDLDSFEKWGGRFAARQLLDAVYSDGMPANVGIGMDADTFEVMDGSYVIGELDVYGDEDVDDFVDFIRDVCNDNDIVINDSPEDIVRKVEDAAMSKTASDWEPYDTNITPELRYDILDKDEIIDIYGGYVDESWRVIAGNDMIGVVSHHVYEHDDEWTWDTYAGFYSYGIDCGICDSKDEAMRMCEESFRNPGFTVGAKAKGSSREEHLGTVEWEAYQVVDGFPASDVPGHMFSHGYDGWYLIRHDDEWGDRRFGPYPSLDALLNAHDLHDGDVRVASVKKATRQFTYAEMKELEDEIEGTELHNADRFKDGGLGYYGSI